MSDSLDKLREKANRPPDDGRLQALRDALLNRGYSATPRKDERAEIDAKDLTQYRKDNLTTAERVLATVYNPGRAAYESSLELIATPLEAAGQLTTIDSLRSAAGGIRGLAAINEDKMLAPDGSRLVEPGFGTKVAGAFGSALGAMTGATAMRSLLGMTGSLGKFAGMGKLAAGAELALGTSMKGHAARLGAINVAQSMFRDAEASGASKGQQYAAFFLGLPLGALEGFGIAATGPTAKLGDIMAKIDKRSGGALGKAILAMPIIIKEGVVEWAQEGTQTFSEKMIAQQILQYAEPEEWDEIWSAVGENALLGGIVGTGLTQLGLTMENRGIKKAKAALIAGAEKDLGRMVLDSAAEISKGMDPNMDSTGAPRTQASPEDAVARFAESAGIEGGLDFEVVDPEKALDPEAEIPTGEVDLYGRLNNIVGQGGQLPPIVTVDDANAPPGAYVDGVVIINKTFQNEMLAGIALHEILHSKARAGSEEFGRLVAEAKEAFPALTLRMAAMYEDAFIKANGQKPFAALPDGPERTALLIEEGFAHAAQHMSLLVDEFISNPESIKPGDVAELKTVLQRIAEWLRNALAKINIGAGGKRSQALAKLDSLLKDQVKRTTQAGAKPEEVVAMAQALARVMREAKIETLPAAPKKGSPDWWRSALPSTPLLPAGPKVERIAERASEREPVIPLGSESRSSRLGRTKAAQAVNAQGEPIPLPSESLDTKGRRYRDEVAKMEQEVAAEGDPIKRRKPAPEVEPVKKKPTPPRPVTEAEAKGGPPLKAEARRQRYEAHLAKLREERGQTKKPDRARRDAGPTAAEAAIEDFERGGDRLATLTEKPTAPKKAVRPDIDEKLTPAQPKADATQAATKATATDTKKPTVAEMPRTKPDMFGETKERNATRREVVEDAGLQGQLIQEDTGQRGQASILDEEFQTEPGRIRPAGEEPIPAGREERVYRISTGAQGKMYTLRVTMLEADGNGVLVPREHYVRNLGTDWTRAVRRALKAARGQDVFGTEFTIDEINRQDAGLLKSGRYRGQSIEDVAAKDPGYIDWLWTSGTIQSKANELVLRHAAEVGVYPSAEALAMVEAATKKSQNYAKYYQQLGETPSEGIAAVHAAFAPVRRADMLREKQASNIYFEALRERKAGTREWHDPRVKPKKIKLDDVQDIAPNPEVTFGKHKGKSIEDVIKRSPKYYEWLKSSGALDGHPALRAYIDQRDQGPKSEAKPKEKPSAATVKAERSLRGRDQLRKKIREVAASDHSTFIHWLRAVGGVSNSGGDLSNFKIKENPAMRRGLPPGFPAAIQPEGKGMSPDMLVRMMIEDGWFAGYTGDTREIEEQLYETENDTDTINRFLEENPTRAEIQEGYVEPDMDPREAEAYQNLKDKGYPRNVADEIMAGEHWGVTPQSAFEDTAPDYSLEMEPPETFFPSDPAIEAIEDFEDFEDTAPDYSLEMEPPETFFPSDPAIENFERGIDRWATAPTDPVPWTISARGEGDFYVQRVGPNAGTPHDTRQGPSDFAVTVDPSVLDPRFFKYLIQYLQPEISRRAHGSVQKTIRKGDIDELVGEHLRQRGADIRRATAPLPDDRSFNDILGNPDAYQVAKSKAGGRSSVKDMGLAAERRARKMRYRVKDPNNLTDAEVQRTAEIMASEVAHQVARDSKAIGWYDKSLKKAFGVLSKAYPELSSDTRERRVFLPILAVTSNGQNVYANFKAALEVYTKYRETGRIPHKGVFGGERQEEIRNALRLIQKLIDENGVDKMHEFLVSRHEVREIKKLGYNIGDAADYVAPGSIIFGPKLGSFHANLSKFYDILTADLWFTRTYNRYIGHSKGWTAATKEKKRENLRKAVRAIQGAKGQRFFRDRGFGKTAVLSDQAELHRFAHALEKELKGFKFDKELVTSNPLEQDVLVKANGLVKELREPMLGAPRNIGERVRMREVVRRAQALLADSGIKIEVSDMQAVLWYYEKELYTEHGAANEVAKGADYADAARVAIAELSARPGVVGRGGARGKRSAGKGTPGRKGPAPDRFATSPTIEVDGQERHRLNSDGKPIAGTDEALRNFWRWFGESKVVDDQGRPLVVYHGSGARAFTVFSAEALGANTGAASAKKGFFFSGRTRNANHYAGDLAGSPPIDLAFSEEERLEEAQLLEERDAHPRWPDDGSFGVTEEWRTANRAHLDFRARMEGKYITGPNVMPVYLSMQNPLIHDMGGRGYRDVSYSDLITKAKRGRREGLIIRNTSDPYADDIYVAFEPTQIKSATGNRGTFSPTDPDIRRATGYHGSPYNFDRFDTSKIGTGEGRQAFGYGVYLAEQQDIAAAYKKALARKGTPVWFKSRLLRSPLEVTPSSDAELAAWNAMHKSAKVYYTGSDNHKRFAIKLVEHMRPWALSREAIRIITNFRGKPPYKIEPEGFGYTVDLAPNDDEYLLWDKLLEDQSDLVSKGLAKTDWYEYAEEQLYNQIDNPTGADLVRWLERDMSPREAAQRLRGAGVRGTKYLDGTSRRNGEGTYNYVIFDAQDLAIIDRWATAPEEGDIPLVNLGKGALLKGVRARQKWLTSRGLLPQSAFDAMLSRDFKVGELNQQLQFDARDFRKALKEVGGMTRGLEKDLDAALRDERLVDRLPEPLREPVLKMRRAIDALSLALLESGAVEGPVEATIRANMGFYLTRSFQAFDDPDWAKKVPEEVRNRAKAFLRAEFAKIGEPNTDVDAWIKNYLFEAAKSKSPIAWLANGKLGSKDLSILKRRKRIAPEIRALLGEYTDPLVNYARSVSKMTFLIANHQFLSEARAAGLDEGYFSEEVRGDTIAKIAADESSVLAPLNGLYTTPDVLEAFTDATSPQVAGQLLQLYMKANSAVKMGKTVGSAQTHVRNVVGNVGFAVAQGHWNLAGTPEALGGFLAGLGISSRADFRKVILEARSYGVTHESAHAGELYDILTEALGGDLNDIATSHIKKSLARRTVDVLTALYMAEDDFWKLLAWGIERQRYAKAYPDWTDAQVKERAAKIVRNTFPTYSLVPRGVKAIRYIPLIGAFTSFPAEVVRVGWNTAHLIKSELADPKTRSIGAQRLAGSLAASLSTTLAALATAFYFGYDDDDREAMREFVPEYSKSHDLVMLGPDKDNKPRYIDISYTDPWSYLKNPINALLRGDSVSEGVFDALKEVAAPFLGEEILAGALMNVRSNQTEAGGSKKVYNDAAPLWTQGKQIAEYLWNKALEPGTVTSVKRIKKGLEGYVSPSGKEYDTEDEVLALVLGQRRSTIDAQQGLIFKARDFSTDTSNANKILSSVASRRGVVDDDEIRDAVVGMEQQRRKIFEDLQKAIKAARQLKVPDPVIADQLEASGVSNYLVRSAIRGVYEPYRVTPSFLQGYESGQSSERIGEIRRRRSLVEDILSELDQ